MIHDEHEWFCKIYDKTIDGEYCWRIAYYVEGILPVSRLPVDVDETIAQKNKETCLKCKYHPK